jgi:hypothetical protein
VRLELAQQEGTDNVRERLLFRHWSFQQKGGLAPAARMEVPHRVVSRGITEATRAGAATPAASPHPLLLLLLGRHLLHLHLLPGGKLDEEVLPLSRNQAVPHLLAEGQAVRHPLLLRGGLHLEHLRLSQGRLHLLLLVRGGVGLRAVQRRTRRAEGRTVN